MPPRQAPAWPGYAAFCLQGNHKAGNSFFFLSNGCMGGNIFLSPCFDGINDIKKPITRYLY
jgi:hypothetical protein